MPYFISTVFYYFLGDAVSSNDISSIVNSSFFNVITNIITNLWTWITSNVYLVFILGVSILFTVIRMFRAIKKTAR